MRPRRSLRIVIAGDIVEFAESGDDEGDVFVGLVLDEMRGLGPRPGLAEDGPVLFVDAVDQDWQQQAVIGLSRSSSRFQRLMLRFMAA